MKRYSMHTLQKKQYGYSPLDEHCICWAFRGHPMKLWFKNRLLWFTCRFQRNPTCTSYGKVLEEETRSIVSIWASHQSIFHKHPTSEKKIKIKKKKETNFVTHLKLLNLQNVGKKCTRLQTFLSSVSSPPLISNLLNLLKLLGFGKQFHLQWVHEFSVEWRTNEQCQQDLQLTGTRWGLTQYFQVMRHHVAFLSLVWLPGSSAKVRQIIIYN